VRIAASSAERDRPLEMRGACPHTLRCCRSRTAGRRATTSCRERREPTDWLGPEAFAQLMPDRTTTPELELTAVGVPL